MTYHNRMQQEFASRPTDEPVRLNKFLSEAGICSRREADRLIEAGRVLVDGRVAGMGEKVLPSQHIVVDGRNASREEEMILLAVNKPRGIVCSSKSQGKDTTIEEFLHYPKRVFSIGRLDKDSEGLLLMTNNGDILNRIMKAANYHEKEYIVWVEKPITEDFLARMAAGVYLPELDVTTRPCKVRQLGKRQFSIVLTQGLNRQIRRMCEGCDNRVTQLSRIRIMNIRLDGIKIGTYRAVTDAEMEELYQHLKGTTS